MKNGYLSYAISPSEYLEGYFQISISYSHDIENGIMSDGYYIDSGDEDDPFVDDTEVFDFLESLSCIGGESSEGVYDLTCSVEEAKAELAKHPCIIENVEGFKAACSEAVAEGYISFV